MAAEVMKEAKGAGHRMPYGWDVRNKKQ